MSKIARMEEEEGQNEKIPKASSLRWKILRKSLVSSKLQPPLSDDKSQEIMNSISRKPNKGFGLIPCTLKDYNFDEGFNHLCVSYSLPTLAAPKLSLFQRRDSCANINDFKVCNKYDIDNTGLVCKFYGSLRSLAVRGGPLILLLVTCGHVQVLAKLRNFMKIFVILVSNLLCFSPIKCKNVIELGAGYGLAGLLIATVSEASEMVISDGNPQVVDCILSMWFSCKHYCHVKECLLDFAVNGYSLYYPFVDIQQSVASNSGAFGPTIVEPKLLHWNQEEFGTLSNKFDVIVASDCTFFKEFHKGLVQTLKSLLKRTSCSKAILFSPKRGDSLDRFLEEVRKSGMNFNVSENYDDKVWERHQQLMKGDQSWPNYDPDHCYPLLVQISWRVITFKQYALSIPVPVGFEVNDELPLMSELQLSLETYMPSIGSH
ncbi:hypothetical protein KSS87_021009 [Heliosperma pusillum]|nr:hypothetical protein KSS87_021009 [Heliosperma pusillum]